ncbi:T9SS type A sorting domain-containing protein [bacterium]|nr:T9SS type A sorting domain-containing protein [bacterium]
MLRRSFILVLLTLLFMGTSLSRAQEIAISYAGMDQKYPSISVCDTNFFIAWEDYRRGTTNINIYGQFIPAEGASPTAGYAISTDDGNQTSPAVGSNGDLFIIIWLDHEVSEYPQLFCRYFDPQTLSFTSSASRVTSTPSYKSRLTVASNGDNFLVLWQDSQTPETIRIKGLLIDPTGSPVDTALYISPRAGKFTVPTLAWNGENYLAVYRDSSDHIGLTGRFLDCEGNPESEPITLLREAPSVNFPEITWDGVTFFLTWQNYDYITYTDVFGCKISTTGEVFPAYLPISLLNANQSNSDAVWGSTAYLTAWQDDRSGLYSDIYGQWVTWNGNLLDTDFIVCDALAGQQDVAVAWNGIRFLAVWGDYRNTYDSDIYGLFIDPPVETSEGPLAYGFIPGPGQTTACADQNIIFRITDRLGIDPGTIQITVNGATYMPDGGPVTVSGDSVIFIPVSPFATYDTIDVEISGIENIAGIPMDSAYNYQFYIDNIPPQIITALPGEGDSIAPDFNTVIIGLWDYSSIHRESILLTLNGISFDLSGGILSYSNDSLTLDFDRTGITLELGDTLEVCIYARDIVDICGSNTLNTCWEAYVEGTGINSSPVIKPYCKLLGSYPNPFNESTTIIFNSLTTGYATIKILDVRGRMVKEVYRIPLEVGTNLFKADLRGEPSGIYYIRIKTENATLTHRTLLLK